MSPVSTVPLSTTDPVSVGSYALQPLLHDLMTCVSSPTVILSASDGQIHATGAQGVFSADIRVLSRAELTVRGRVLEPISSALIGADTAEFRSLLRSVQDNPDPDVWIRRRRTAGPAGVDEVLELVNNSASDVGVLVELRVAADLLDMESVKSGCLGHGVRPIRVDEGLRFAAGNLCATMTCPGAEVEVADHGAVVRWSVSAGSRSSAVVGWSLQVLDPAAVVSAADPDRGFRAPVVVANERRLTQLLAQSVADLRALRMSTPLSPVDEFLAAGSPWYLTLFGRDSIWAARMMLPLGTTLAAGTLRTLARRQGTGENPVTAEEPGKILHEIRRLPGALADSFLPPVYYGTVDATPLWVCLLADAWRWGMDPDEVRALLPAAEAALAWMVDYGDSDDDGFLEYIDKSGAGLANQGWKDSGDSVRFADGTLAVGPVALAEVQGYAYEAAMSGADLLEAFGRPGARRWRDHAASLKQRFREKYWATDDLGDYPVLALDGRKRQVDAPASNMGHLLATGILSDTEAAAVAARLVHPSMSSGFGLRTMSSSTGGYSALSYHCGSVWPHDTAIAIHGLMRAGFAVEAMVLAEGLLAAGAAFGGRLPELYGGFSRQESPVPVPYPASCRPQAWSAASAVVLLQTYLGLEADVPAGTVRISPADGIGALSVSGLQIAGSNLDVEVRADRGSVTAGTDAGVRIHFG
ncbi:glycogen debranching N-terminal domain-containing protein [Nakamurella sp. PAMC28650]|uniref:glycogen debranching N-terminal domain-containing protein n=1 Tax=Nakamurella sp. PAMC28650 TaxID=2762325 RepID=UPI00164E995F|nr:amylo-alpha-1,6-glucosidase [Nakamurella sp. PAMC28650]